MGESYGLLWRGFLSYNIRHDTYMTDITLDVHDLYGACGQLSMFFKLNIQFKSYLNILHLMLGKFEYSGCYYLTIKFSFLLPYTFVN